MNDVLLSRQAKHSEVLGLSERTASLVYVVILPLEVLAISKTVLLLADFRFVSVYSEVVQSAKATSGWLAPVSKEVAVSLGFDSCFLSNTHVRGTTLELGGHFGLGLGHVVPFTFIEKGVDRLRSSLGVRIAKSRGMIGVANDRADVVLALENGVHGTSLSQ